MSIIVIPYVLVMIGVGAYADRIKNKSRKLRERRCEEANQDFDK